MVVSRENLLSYQTTHVNTADDGVKAVFGSCLQLRTFFVEVDLKFAYSHSWIARMVSAIISPFFHKITLRILFTKPETLKRLFLPEVDDALDERVRKVDEVMILLSPTGPTHPFLTSLGDVKKYFNEEMPEAAARRSLKFAYSEGMVSFSVQISATS